MDSLLPLLISLPLGAALLLLCVRGERLRAAVVVAASAALIAATVFAAVRHGGEDVFFALPGGHLPGGALLGLDALLAAVFVVLGLRHRRLLAPALALLQLAASAFVEWSARGEPDPLRALHVDRLAMVLLVIAGVLGPLICVHALGYMPDYQRGHPEVRDRRPLFFSLLFLFLAAMAGLVTANHLPLLFLCWEVTTLCSFLLIGYAGDEAAIGNAFAALEVNLLGGLGFAFAELWLAGSPAGLDLARLAAAPASAAVLPALAALALAGLTKSAQLPFSGWLLRAMHAPTPTSALLHSSTMVKAGVFLLLRLSPALRGNAVGAALMLAGLCTFFFAALAATTEQNAKRVLALSTISNLGLVAACAGLATPEAAWAGVMLVIFHAAAKSLLFLVVGTLENRLHTKDLESFDHLLSRLPRVTALLLAGIAGMFLAPFGVVIAKWSALRAFLVVPGLAGAASLLLLAFGSACTIFYWAKLLLKVLAQRRPAPDEAGLEAEVPLAEWLSETVQAALVVALAAGVGLLSSRVVAPLALGLFSAAPRPLLAIPPGMVAGLVAAVLALPAAALWQRGRGRFDLADIYVGGRTADAGHRVGAALGGSEMVAQRNYYLEGVVDGGRVLRAATVLGAGLLAALLVALLLPFAGGLR